MESKNSGRNDIDKEVSTMVKKYSENPKSQYAILTDLRNKHKDEEVVDTIMNKYNNKLKKVQKLAEKIRMKLLHKYPNLSMKELIGKVALYKKKYDFDDSEMAYIVHLLFHNKSGLSSNEFLDVTYNEMSKALGFVPMSLNFSGKISVKPDELDQLNEILKIEAMTKELHHQVTLQSLIYDDTEYMGLQGNVDKTKSNIFSYIHPVVAALFLPKFKYLDEHMLIASIPKIVQLRNQGLELSTQPDYELYMDIATDPAETHCTGSRVKPFHDLLSRVNIQVKLWESVLNLRQGKYYMNDLTSFIAAIDNCKTSLLDSVDFTFVKDEGTIMRKLLNAFSIRPIIVSSSPVVNVSTTTSNISSLAVTHITTLPMLSLRIPFNDYKKTENISLNDALHQNQIYFHHGRMTVISQEIMYAREILIFYVYRRHKTINLDRIAKPYQMAILPVTMNQFERLHDAHVDFNTNLEIKSQNFVLTSVVAVETAPNDPNLIISCSALINLNNIDNASVIYKPLDLSGNDPSTIKPLLYAPYSGVSSNSDGDETETMCYKASKQGTLFIYKCSDSGQSTTHTLFSY